MLEVLSRLKHSPRTASIRRLTNLLYYDPNILPVDLRNIDEVVVDSFRFKVSNQINSLQRVYGNPWFSGARRTDIALDLGANIGSVTLPLSSMVKKVYSVEPLYWKELEDNLALNGVSNVEVLKIGVGNKGSEELISFAGRRSIVPLKTFRSIRTSIGWDIGFLKMDIEGAEWSIDPEELRGIRELRIEFHIRRDNVKACKKGLGIFLSWMDSRGYSKVVEHPFYGPDPFDKEDYMVRASLDRSNV